MLLALALHASTAHAGTPAGFGGTPGVINENTPHNLKYLVTIHNTEGAGYQLKINEYTGGGANLCNAPAQMLLEYNIDDVYHETRPPFAPIAGDFDGDGDVDDRDLGLWNRNFGINDFSDMDYDGFTGGSDFLVWQRHWGRRIANTSFIAPEPRGDRTDLDRPLGNIQPCADPRQPTVFGISLDQETG